MSSIEQFSGYSSSLDAIKKPFSDPLDGVLSYRDGNDNSSLSIKFFPQAKTLVHGMNLHKAICEMKMLQDKAFELLESVQDDQSLTNGQKNFLENAINHTILNYDMLLDAVYVEAEKGGKVIDQERKNTLLASIEEKETQLYGPRVSDIAEERDAVLASFASLFEQRGGLLVDHDKEIFTNFLGDFGVVRKPGLVEDQEAGVLYDQHALWEIFSRVYQIYHKETIKVYIQKDRKDGCVQDDICYIPASRNDKEKDTFYTAHNIAKHAKVCFSDTASNISVGSSYSSGSHSIVFPVDNAYSRERICRLIDHEDATHFIRSENAYRGVQVRSAGYLETEEGIAMTNEGAVTVLNLDDLTAGEPTLHHLSTFVAENYDYDQTKSILRAYFVMMGKSEADAAREAARRADRVKRFHAYDRPGANRKDVVYRRGKRKVVDFLQKASIEELQQWRDMMYRGKFAEQDVDAIPTLLGDRATEYQMPLALGKILYQRSLGVKMSALKEKDKRFQLSGDELSREQSRLLVEILSFVDGNDKCTENIGTLSRDTLMNQ